MTDVSRLNADPTDNPTTLASEWIILNSGCEDLMSYEEWCKRWAAAVAYIDTWSEDERTEFFYAVAKRACTVPALLPTPGLRMTPEATAAELRRLNHLVYNVDDGCEDSPDYDWITFIDPVLGGMTLREKLRYAHEGTRLAFGHDLPCRLRADPPD